MPLRNLFGRRPTPEDHFQDENALSGEDTSSLGFERVDTIGSKSSSAVSIRSGRSFDTGSYKLSVVNDSGVYLPPSPTEDPLEKGFWPRRLLSSRTSLDAHESVGDIEHFSISRESFDSYRRSFDISARSPIIGLAEPSTRQSLDSTRFSRPHQPPFTDRVAKTEPNAEQDDFEDVGLDADADIDSSRMKRKFFSLFESQDGGSLHPPPGPGGVSRFLPSRKRAQSGTGAELRPMGPPTMAQEPAVLTTY